MLAAEAGDIKSIQKYSTAKLLTKMRNMGMLQEIFDVPAGGGIDPLYENFDFELVSVDQQGDKAVVSFRNASVNNGPVTQFVVIQQDGRWLVDDEIVKK